MRALWVLILSAGFAVGCRQDQPSAPGKGDEPARVPPTAKDPPAPTKPSISQEEYDKRIKAEFAVVYLILRGEKPDQVKRSKVVERAVEGLRAALDEEPPGGHMSWNGDGPFLTFRQLGLVKDVEAFGLRQKVGRVLAYDSDKRAMVIDVGVPPAARAEWKGAADLDRLVTAHTIRMGLSRVAEQVKDHPADQHVYLQFRGELAKQLFVGVVRIAPSKDRIKALLDGPAEMRSVSQHAVSLGTDDVGLVVAPVKDFAAFARKFDFAEVLFADSETRVLILGQLKKQRE